MEPMLLHGKYGTAKIYTYTIESAAQAKIMQLLNQEWIKGTNPCFMPDVHDGKGCLIGTTLDLKNADVIVPALVGSDIGCGMEVVPIKETEVDYEKLDNFLRYGDGNDSLIKRNIVHLFLEHCKINELRCYKDISGNKDISLQFATLGTGNHFIELDKRNDGGLVCVIHSGSRALGHAVCNHYQKKAQENVQKNAKYRYSAGFEYIEGQDMDDYLHDMKIVQKYASWNRKAMACEIVKYMDWHVIPGSFSTAHNYIDTDNMILRKGSISAQNGELVIIPLSMKDGAIIAVGKGNADWNYSAPHGAGRLMSRSQAKETLSVETFRNAMKGIYNSCIGQTLIDESPMAYKDPAEIIEYVSDTVDIKEIIAPVFNFKNSGK